MHLILEFLAKWKKLLHEVIFLQLDAYGPWTLIDGFFNIFAVLLFQLQSNMAVYLFSVDFTMIFFALYWPTALASVEHSFSMIL